MTTECSESLLTADDPQHADAAFDTLQAGNVERDRTSRARFGVELIQAKLSLRLLLICAVAVPLLALCTWVGIGALVVSVLDGYGARWASALTLGITLQVLIFAGLMRQMRRWWRDLGMPQSQAALGRGQQRMDVDQARKHAEGGDGIAQRIAADAAIDTSSTVRCVYCAEAQARTAA